jgi:hypothetical protein
MSSMSPIPHGLKRSAKFAVLFVAVTLCLVGCTPVDRISARLVNGEIEFAVCETVDANHIDVSIQPYDDWGSGEKIVWQVSGEGSFREGDRFTYGSQLDGFIDVISAESFDPVKFDIAVGLLEVDLNGDPQTGISGLFDGRKLTTEKWLDWNGNLRKDSC